MDFNSYIGAYKRKEQGKRKEILNDHGISDAYVVQKYHVLSLTLSRELRSGLNFRKLINNNLILSLLPLVLSPTMKNY